MNSGYRTYLIVWILELLALWAVVAVHWGSVSPEVTSPLAVILMIVATNGGVCALYYVSRSSRSVHRDLAVLMLEGVILVWVFLLILVRFLASENTLGLDMEAGLLLVLTDLVVMDYICFRTKKARPEKIREVAECM